MTTVEFLDRLIAFDTVSHKSNLDLIAYVEDLLNGHGFRVTRLPSPCGTKAGLYAEIGPEIEGGLLLSAHTDVVPVTGQNWTKPPFQLTAEGDKFYGRGTTDMKGFVACALALAVKAKTVTLQRPVAILLSYDEEIGCVGLQEIRDRVMPLLRASSLCIVGEPTEMQIAIGHKGKSTFKAKFHGEAGHSALSPKFRNALHLAADFVQELRGVQAEISENGPYDAGYEVPYTTVHVGKLSGGTALNIVPELAELDFEIRYLAQQDMTALMDHINLALERLGVDGQQPQADLTQTNNYPGLDVDMTQPWVTDVASVAKREFTKVAFGTEAGILSEMGIPTVVCGPGSMSGQGHKADEFIAAQQLYACDAFLDNLLRRLC